MSGAVIQCLFLLFARGDPAATRTQFPRPSGRVPIAGRFFLEERVFLIGDHILKPSLIDATGVDGNFSKNILSIMIKGSSHEE